MESQWFKMWLTHVLLNINSTVINSGNDSMTKHFWKLEFVHNSGRGKIMTKGIDTVRWWQGERYKNKITVHWSFESHLHKLLRAWGHFDFILWSSRCWPPTSCNAPSKNPIKVVNILALCEVCWKKTESGQRAVTRHKIWLFWEYPSKSKHSSGNYSHCWMVSNGKLGI